MTMATDANVRISASLASDAGLKVDFGRSLYLAQDSSTPTTAAAIAQQRSTRGATAFATATAVDAAYPAGSQPREAAAVYFQQSPYPKNLVIGQQIATAQDGYVFGFDPGTVDYAALGSTSLELGGTSFNVNFSAVTTLAAAAGVIQTAMRAVRFGATATATVVSGALVVTSPQAQSIGTGFTNSATARALGLFGQSVQVFDGLAAETPVQALSRIETEDDSWYYVALDPAIYDTSAVVDIANWVNARVNYLAQDSTQGSALTTGETTSFLAQVSALGQQRAFGVWSASADHKALSLAGRMGSVDFERPGSATTAKFRQLPGTTPDVLTTAQQDELRRKRVNFYTEQHGAAIVAEGTAYDGWIDERIWLDWFVNRMRMSIFSQLVGSRRIPQTDDGMAALLDGVIGVCEIGVNSGFIAPGNVSPALAAEITLATGNADFDGFLSTGYLVYAPPIAEQSLADRQARVSPPINVWVKGGGALHRVDIAILFEG